MFFFLYRKPRALTDRHQEAHCSLAAASQPQNEDEDVDNINVQLKSTIDVLFGGDFELATSNNLLCVKHQELKEKMSKKKRLRISSNSPDNDNLEKTKQNGIE